MRLLSTTMGRIIVSATVGMIVLVCIASSFLPGIKTFLSTVFPVENNYVAPTAVEFDTFLDYESKDNYRENVIELVVDLEDDTTDDFDPDEDIFDNFIVSNSVDQALVDKLKEDYQKEPYTKRSRVFVYKMDKQGYSLLVDKIDPTTPGEWVVIYVLDDDDKRSALRVDYVFMN